MSHGPRLWSEFTCFVTACASEGFSLAASLVKAMCVQWGVGTVRRCSFHDVALADRSRGGLRARVRAFGSEMHVGVG